MVEECENVLCPIKSSGNTVGYLEFLRKFCFDGSVEQLKMGLQWCLRTWNI